MQHWQTPGLCESYQSWSPVVGCCRILSSWDWVCLLLNARPSIITITQSLRSNDKTVSMTNLSGPSLHYLLYTMGVRPSVRPPARPPALYCLQFWLDLFHIYTSYQTTSEGVSRLKFLAKFEFLALFFKYGTLTLSCFGWGISERRRSSCSCSLWLTIWCSQLIYAVYSVKDVYISRM